MPSCYDRTPLEAAVDFHDAIAIWRDDRCATLMIPDIFGFRRGLARDSQSLQRSSLAVGNDVADVLDPGK